MLSLHYPEGQAELLLPGFSPQPGDDPILRPTSRLRHHSAVGNYYQTEQVGHQHLHMSAMWTRNQTVWQWWMLHWPNSLIFLIVTIINGLPFTSKLLKVTWEGIGRWCSIWQFNLEQLHHTMFMKSNPLNFSTLSPEMLLQNKTCWVLQMS